jgi:hypothetical protein
MVDMAEKGGFSMANKVIIKGSSNSVEIKPVGNSVEIVEPVGNSVEIVEPVGNSVECSLFDVTTTSYFLSAVQTLEEHREAE